MQPSANTSEDASAERWRIRLETFKQLNDLTDLAIAQRLGTSQSIVNRIRNGSVSMPGPVRVRFADIGGLKSLRRLLQELLPEQALQRANGGDTPQKKLPQEHIKALMAGNENPLWIALLDALKADYGTDRQLADTIGTTRNLLSVVRATSARLPLEVKLRVIARTDYVVTDKVLLSLLPRPTFNAIVESIEQRPVHSRDKMAFAWEKPLAQ